MQNIYPLVLCGGIGSRLWPLSRTEHPKQFQRIDAHSTKTFFQSTIERHRMPGLADPIVAVSSAHVDTVRRQLNDIGCPANIISEPISRNTGPAVLAAALRLAEADPTGLLCVLPSDHIVRGNITKSILNMRHIAEAGKIVLFGVRPEYAETGFGYIVRGARLNGEADVFDAAKFVEKPDVATAFNLINTGNALWASGISLFRADVLISEFQRLDPDTYQAVEKAVTLGTRFEDMLHLNAEAMVAAASLPTEKIIFESSPLMVVTPLNVAWSDVGAWNALHHIGEKDDDGNVLNGDIVCLDTTSSYIRSSGKLVTVVGMRNVVIVDTDDALLVTTRDKADQVKALVKVLEGKKRREITHHLRDQQAWGELFTIQKGVGYELRMMRVRRGLSMSFSHEAGAQRMLTVAEGSGLLKTDSTTRALSVGDTFEVGLGQTVVLFNSPEKEMQIVEIVCEIPAIAELKMPLDQLIPG
jgi:mannose-1-phosphate guanylyltransferase / mannose-6-phosphate isomerase